MYNKIINLVGILSILFLFNACSSKEVELHQRGDELLNCQKLTTKIANIIDINSDINDKTGLETKSIATWVIWPPLGGLNQVNASFQRGDVDDRFIELMNLKIRNNCKLTISEKSFIKDKGRFSDLFNDFLD